MHYLLQPRHRYAKTADLFRIHALLWSSLSWNVKCRQLHAVVWLSAAEQGLYVGGLLVLCGRYYGLEPLNRGGVDGGVFFSKGGYRLTPSLSQPVKFPGGRVHGRACKQYISRSCNICFQCYAFWWKSFHMPVRKRRRKDWRVSNFALIWVVFKWHHGSEGVNSVFQRWAHALQLVVIDCASFVHCLARSTKTARQYLTWAIPEVLLHWSPWYNRTYCYIGF